VPVAVELIPGARSLHDYVHPERAFYVFGPEDSSLGKDTLKWCRDVVYIPMNGCSNLAATVNVVLYDRASKRQHTTKAKAA
jgi:tRNA(Leu) C34 or U34 (ribose-2'-O)-methylase TrmL